MKMTGKILSLFPLPNIAKKKIDHVKYIHKSSIFFIFVLELMGVQYNLQLFTCLEIEVDSQGKFFYSFFKWDF